MCRLLPCLETDKGVSQTVFRLPWCFCKSFCSFVFAVGLQLITSINEVGFYTVLLKLFMQLQCKLSCKSNHFCSAQLVNRSITIDSSVPQTEENSILTTVAFCACSQCFFLNSNGPVGFGCLWHWSAEMACSLLKKSSRFAFFGCLLAFLLGFS